VCWTPGAAETLKAQLEYLDGYEQDGLTSFKLLRQAVDFALRMRATAKDEQTTIANRQMQDAAAPAATRVQEHAIVWKEIRWRRRRRSYQRQSPGGWHGLDLAADLSTLTAQLLAAPARAR
jgi:hypothetical protein